MKAKILVLFIGLFMAIGASAQDLVNHQKEFVIFGNAENNVRAEKQPINVLNWALGNFSLAKTPEELMAAASQETENQKAEDPPAEDSSENSEESSEEEREVTIVVPSRPGTILGFEIAGVEFSLAIEPAIYRNPYIYPYGLWSYSWYGWYGSYGWYPWRNPRYHYIWDYIWGPYAGFGRSSWRDRNRTPVYRDQLKDYRRASATQEPTLLAQSNISPVKPNSMQSSSQVMSYPSSKKLTNAKQKFNGRISAKYTSPRPNKLLMQRPTTPRNARLSTQRQATRNSSIRSRSTARFTQPRRSSSPRISSPNRSSTPRNSAIRSSSARSSASVRSGIRSTASRKTSSRPASSKGTAVRKN